MINKWHPIQYNSVDNQKKGDLPLTCLPWPYDFLGANGTPLLNGCTHSHFQARQNQGRPLYMTAKSKEETKDGIKLSTVQNNLLD